MKNLECSHVLKVLVLVLLREWFFSWSIANFLQTVKRGESTFHLKSPFCEHYRNNKGLQDIVLGTFAEHSPFVPEHYPKTANIIIKSST